MTNLQPSGWRIGKLFTGSFGRGNAEAAARAKADETVVRLIDSPRRVSPTAIQQRLIAALKKTGSASLANLVRVVSEDLYAEELRMGAGVLDIGLFGSRLFHNEVVRDLRAGDGTFWQINKQRDITR